MNNREILALYDKEVRQGLKTIKGRKEVLPELIRQIYDDPKRNSFIVYNQVTRENADAVIEREIAYFRELGRNLEWSAFEHDPFPDLHLRLADYGFEVEEELESIMALDMTAPPEKLMAPVTADIRQIHDPAGVEEVIEVEEAVWQTDYSWLKSKLIEDLQERPNEIAIFAGYEDGKAVSSGWIFFHPGTHFTSMYGGSTLATHRNKGFYTGLVAVRMQEAVRRGFRFLTIDAGSMSRPIVAKLGFQLLTIGHECNLALGDG